MSDRLTRLISRHVDRQVVCDRWCSCGVQHPLGYAAHLAEVIAAEFLVMPRGDIVGTEYGYRYKEPKCSERTQSTGRHRDEAIEVATYLRNEQVRKCLEVNAEALSRPQLPWSPIPLEEVPDGT